MKDKHQRTAFMCNLCGKIDSRQNRYFKSTSKPLCTSCLRSTIRGIKCIPTVKLKEIIDNDGISASGRSYEDYIDEIKEVYYDRLRIQEQKYIEERTQDVCPF